VVGLNSFQVVSYVMLNMQEKTEKP